MSISKWENVGLAPAWEYAENLRTVPVSAKTSEEEVVNIVDDNKDVNEIEIENEPGSDFDLEETKNISDPSKLKVKAHLE